MGKKVLKADTVVKNYWRNNEQFADIFNAVLFNGNKVIKPEELEDMDTEESLVLEHKEYIQSIVAARDNVKSEKNLPLMMLNLLYLDWRDRNVSIMQCR